MLDVCLGDSRSECWFTVLEKKVRRARDMSSFNFGNSWLFRKISLSIVLDKFGRQRDRQKGGSQKESTQETIVVVFIR